MIAYIIATAIIILSVAFGGCIFIAKNLQNWSNTNCKEGIQIDGEKVKYPVRKDSVDYLYDLMALESVLKDNPKLFYYTLSSEANKMLSNCILKSHLSRIQQETMNLRSKGLLKKHYKS